MYPHRRHIPQPPHSAGLSYEGLRSHIEPSQVPSPTVVIESDKQEWTTQPFMTLPGKHVPLSTSDFITIDQGNSSPKFVRISTWNVPKSSGVASECEIPIAAVFQPFADQDPNEEPVTLVETGEGGPARCEMCRGYINPWCTWTSGGMRWKCNLCTHETEVSPEYFCNLDANLMRLDHLQRPELTKGTIDFAVSEEYWATHAPQRLNMLYHSLEELSGQTRRPESMRYVFAFDVSTDAVASGFLAIACSSLRSSLFGSTNEDGSVLQPCFPPHSRIAIVTYDRNLHFYNLSAHLQQAPMMVLPDLDEIFLPLREGLFADVLESRHLIENLLENIPKRHLDISDGVSALGAALSASLAALAGRGGQVIVFHSTMPTVGPGALNANVGETNVLGESGRDSVYFVPRNKFWINVGEQCAEEGIGVSMFLGTSRFVDVGSIGFVASITGGDIFFHPRFEASRDGPILDSQMRRLFSRTTAYNCMMRVRCSNGLRISRFYGNFYQRSPTDLEFGVLDADKAISVALEHSHSLDERSHAYVQAAVLYTLASGQRRVRILNLALEVAALAGNVFRFGDMDTVVCHMSRQAIAGMTSRSLSQIREDVTQRCCSLLLGYRRNCAAASSHSQLVLPEAFRSLPVYVLAILKSKPLKGRSVSADVRNYYAHRIRSMSVRSTLQHLYPRLLALHDLDDQFALPDPVTGQIRLPSMMRNTHTFMEAHGAYLIDNEEVVIIWIGASISPQILSDLFGVEDILQLDPHLTRLPVLQTRLSAQVRNILVNRAAQRGYILKLLIARQNLDGTEIDFSDMLVEDQNNGALSYVDYLSLVHKEINKAILSDLAW